MSFRIYENGAWRDSSTNKIYENGSWRDAQYGRAYENGSWVDKLSYVMTNPQNLYSYGDEVVPLTGGWKDFYTREGYTDNFMVKNATNIYMGETSGSSDYSRGIMTTKGIDLTNYTYINIHVKGVIDYKVEFEKAQYFVGIATDGSKNFRFNSDFSYLSPWYTNGIVTDETYFYTYSILISPSYRIPNAYIHLMPTGSTYPVSHVHMWVEKIWLT